MLDGSNAISPPVAALPLIVTAPLTVASSDELEAGGAPPPPHPQPATTTSPPPPPPAPPPLDVAAPLAGPPPRRAGGGGAPPPAASPAGDHDQPRHQADDPPLRTHHDSVLKLPVVNSLDGSIIAQVEYRR